MADDRTDADSGERGGWFGRHQQVAWIGVFGAVAAALIAAVVPALLDSSGDDEPAGGAEPVAAPSSTSAAPPDVTSSPPSADPSASDPTSSPAGSERWQGVLLLDAEPKDLDADQPVAVGYADNGDVYMVSSTVIEGGHGTVVSLWQGDPTSPPGFEECASTVDAQGADRQQLTDDSVLCVRTSAGNLARLTVTEPASGTDYSTTFDAVVWAGS